MAVNDTTAAIKVCRALSAADLTLAVAESCTGGLLGSTVTDVPGSSAVFLGAIVAYSYEAKERLLGVNRENLVQHGAVSEQIAKEMAQGAAHGFWR